MGLFIIIYYGGGLNIYCSPNNFVLITGNKHVGEGVHYFFNAYIYFIIQFSKNV